MIPASNVLFECPKSAAANYSDTRVDEDLDDVEAMLTRM